MKIRSKYYPELYIGVDGVANKDLKLKVKY